MKNPVDVIGDARADRYKAALERVLDDPHIDQALVILTPQSMTDIESIAEGICEIHEDAKKPISCAFMGATDVVPGIHLLQHSHIPHYILPEWACTAMADVQKIRQWQSQPLDVPERVPADQSAARQIIEGAESGYLLESQALDVLAAYGLPVPRHRLCASADEAVDFAEEIGYPVVLRVVSPQIVHKWDVKGVVLNLANANAIREGYERMLANIEKANPQAEIRGVLTRRMIPDGYEVIIGAKRDPSFGPTLMFGLGGLYVGLFKDVTFALAPIAPGRAGRMLRQVKAFRLLEGARGGPGADIEGIQDCLVRVGQLVSDFERIVELDVNPLIAGPAEVGNAVADVRIRLGE
jgi:acetyltransferase